MSDNVNKPSHYSAGSVETIDAIKSALGDAFLDYCRGNVLKYVWRCRHKGNLLEDLRKASKYLEWAIAEAKSENPSKQQPLAIPEGWRELELRETPKKTDMYESVLGWVVRSEDAFAEYEWYDVRHIRKIETANPSHVEGVWVEEADANAKKIESAEASDASLPDPGEGYRLLSKDPPEQVIRGDEFWQNFNREWVESENFIHEGGPQAPELYYRRKIEPTEWTPKVGDKVRVVKPGRLTTGMTGVVSLRTGGYLSVWVEAEKMTSHGLLPKELELIEAAS